MASSSLTTRSPLPFTERRAERPRAPVGHRLLTLAGKHDILTCPDGHCYSDVWIWEWGVMPCRHRDPDGGAPCPWAAYLVGGGLHDLSNEPLTLVTHVTITEAMEMRRQQMSLDTALRYLGLRAERRVA